MVKNMSCIVSTRDGKIVDQNLPQCNSRPRSRFPNCKPRPSSRRRERRRRRKIRSRQWNHENREIQFSSKVFGTDRDNSDDGVDELSDAKDELGFEAVWVERIAPLVHAQLHHHRHHKVPEAVLLVWTKMFHIVVIKDVCDLKQGIGWKWSKLDLWQETGQAIPANRWSFTKVPGQC